MCSLETHPSCYLSTDYGNSSKTCVEISVVVTGGNREHTLDFSICRFRPFVYKVRKASRDPVTLCGAATEMKLFYGAMRAATANWH